MRFHRIIRTAPFRAAPDNVKPFSFGGSDTKKSDLKTKATGVGIFAPPPLAEEIKTEIALLNGLLIGYDNPDDKTHKQIKALLYALETVPNSTTLKASKTFRKSL